MNIKSYHNDEGASSGTHPTSVKANRFFALLVALISVLCMTVVAFAAPSSANASEISKQERIATLDAAYESIKDKADNNANATLKKMLGASQYATMLQTMMHLSYIQANGTSKGADDPMAMIDILDYNLQKLWHQGYDGSGVTVAFVVSGPIPVDDLTSELGEFDKALKLPAVDLSEYTLTRNGSLKESTGTDVECTVQCHGSLGEIKLDAESIHAIAPYAKIKFVSTQVPETFGIQGFPELTQAIKTIADTDFADIVSVSQADVEADHENDPLNPGADRSAQLKNLETAFVDAAAKGVSVSFSSGDTGSTGSPVLSTGKSVGVSASFPASPWITVVGGTSPNASVGSQEGANPGYDYGDGADRDGDGKVDGVRTAGADGLWVDSDNSGSDTGAGVSKVFDQPSWQKSNLALQSQVAQYSSMNGGAGGRTYPDISLDGIGGTSHSSPTFAGMVALATQMLREKTGDATARIGNAASEIATLGLAGGDNGILDVTGGESNSVQGVAGYSTADGYDIASGWGTIDASTFVPALVGQVQKTGASQRQTAIDELARRESDISVVSQTASVVKIAANGYIPGESPRGTAIKTGYGVYPPVPGQSVPDDPSPSYQTPTEAMKRGQPWDSVSVRLSAVSRARSSSQIAQVSTGALAGDTSVKGVTLSSPDDEGKVLISVDATSLEPGTYHVAVDGKLVSQQVEFTVKAAATGKADGEATGKSDSAGTGNAVNPRRGSADARSSRTHHSKVVASGRMAATGAGVTAAVVLLVLSAVAGVIIVRRRDVHAAMHNHNE
jgi:hypothetical protein